MSAAERRKARGLAEGPWSCPACDGEVRPEDPTERRPVRCGACGTLYRHPRMAILLALALPGLGSFYQRRVGWGTLALALGTMAFVVTMLRILGHLAAAIRGEPPDLEGLLLESGLGLAVVVTAYLMDLAAVWARRGRLVPHGRGARGGR